jgi:predicted DNA-binding protein with PD1-like motif
MESLDDVRQERLQPAHGGGAWVLRLKPYEDLVTALCNFCADQGVRRVAVLGCVGSLMHATLLGPERRVRRVEGPGIEIVTAAGWVDREHPGLGTLTLTVADREGSVSAGRAAAGGNPVCVTVELMVQEWT